MVTDGDFQDAAKHPKLRQEFLSQLDLESAKPYFTDIVYASRWRKFIEGDGIMHHFPGICNKRTNRLIVHPKAFTWRFHHTLTDFLSTLIDHEGHHAYEQTMHPETRLYTLALALREPISLISHYLDRPTLKASRFKAGTELRAYQNQLRNARARRISPDYEEEIKNRCDLLAEALASFHSARRDKKRR